MSPVIISRLYQLLYKWFEFELGELFKVEISTFFMVSTQILKCNFSCGNFLGEF